MKLKLCIEYHGAAFSGWQVQLDQKTVQGELERALGVYLQSLAKEQAFDLDRTPRTTASGRTDAGVHAKAQIVSFSWPENFLLNRKKLLRSLNGISDGSLYIKSIEEVDETFDARRSPHRKCYCYSLIDGQANSPLNSDFALFVPQKLEFISMLHAASLFKGTHDFKSFQVADCAANTTVRTILASELVRDRDGLIKYYVIGNGFLKQMVRTMVGTLIEVGLKKRSPESILEILEARDRCLAGPVVEAKGLTLEWVKYD